MKFILNHFQVVVAAAAGLATFAFTPALFAAPCDDLGLDPEKVIYGSGGSAVTPVLGAIAVGLQALPEDERFTIFYDDTAGACGGYSWWRTPVADQGSFKYWLADTPVAEPLTCEAPRDRVQFAHMGNTPALCPGDVPVPEGAAKFFASIQTVNFITDIDSQEESISAEAAYHIYGFGPGVHDIAPWNNPAALFGRQASAFVSVFIASIIGVPAASFVYQPANIFTTNGAVVSAVAAHATPEEALGFVSGSNAQAGEFPSEGAPRVKTLAYQHFDQTCAYLPDSERGTSDRANVRSGQYYIWTPGWFYAHVDDEGVAENEHIRNLIGWTAGTIDSPEGIPVQEIVIQAGDVPLCAMHAIRPEGDVSAIQSYAPANPCNGWYEFVATGETSYQTCNETADCDGAEQSENGDEIGEQCRYGYCEAY